MFPLRSKMPSMDIEPLLRQREGKTVEFKRDLSSPTPVLRTLVAFANSAGGDLVLGVADDRSVVGVEDPLACEERLGNLIADSIQPRLLPEIEIVPWRRLSLVVVRVHPSSSRPHHLTKDGPEYGTYVRLGSTNRRADADLRAEFQRRINRQSYDEQPASEFNSEAIDFRAASEYFAELRTLRRKDLETLGVVTRHQGRIVPTIGGMLLFGKERMLIAPDAWIQAGRFDGTDKAHLVDRAEFREYPVTAMEHAIAFVERNTQLRASIGRLRRKDSRAVPPSALREAMVNAVVHADYAQRGAPMRVSVFDDRIEIENAGILLPGLTIDEMREGVSRIRNRVIGRVFQELGLVEQWGTGIQRMMRACVEAGLPEPEFAELGLRFRVTLRTEAIQPADTDAVDRRLLSFLHTESGRSTAEIAKHLGLSSRAVQTRLARLSDLRLAVVVGSGPRDPRRKWHVGARSSTPEK